MANDFTAGLFHLSLSSPGEKDYKALLSPKSLKMDSAHNITNVNV